LILLIYYYPSQTLSISFYLPSYLSSLFILYPCKIISIHYNLGKLNCIINPSYYLHHFLILYSLFIIIYISIQILSTPLSFLFHSSILKTLISFLTFPTNIIHSLNLLIYSHILSILIYPSFHKILNYLSIFYPSIYDNPKYYISLLLIIYPKIC
jgi:hypothetical protein